MKILSNIEIPPISTVTVLHDQDISNKTNAILYQSGTREPVLKILNNIFKSFLSKEGYDKRKIKLNILMKIFFNIFSSNLC